MDRYRDALDRLRRLLPLFFFVLAACASTGPANLPLVEVPSSGSGDSYAVLITGDGGWRSIDVEIAKRLAAAGIPVVGFPSPAYFRTRRTAEESAVALEQIMRTYSARWSRPRAVLIGYSRGADVLPFMAARLPAELRASVRLVALLGLEPEIDFRYHPSWIPFYHPQEQQFPVLPEVEKLRGLNVLCVYGEREKNTLCRTLDPSLVKIVAFPGSHHFGGHYDRLAEAILNAAQ
jgi:type IV secretory pathway VirJ component